MCDTIVHRGPDSEGIWVDADVGIALGHRRLAIVDLSDAGHQPMHSASSRYVIAYNGEIYNALEIREQLLAKGITFRGHSDTEIFLAAVDEWGLDSALRKAKGMFALALWDRQKRTLSLARDRIGEKPLYYGWSGEGHFVFGSQLSPLRATGWDLGNISREALSGFLQFGYVPAPLSIFDRVRKVLPGQLIEIDIGHPGEFRASTYWNLLDVASSGISAPLSGSDQELTRVTEAVLTQAIRRQMISDVPLGAFLSGGIDSSLVVALMQSVSAKPVKTFTIGFDNGVFDESRHAHRVAERLGTDHTQLILRPSELLEIVPMIPKIFDEPFADSSQIPTYLVSRLARGSVTVSLSGDGGDEMFGGYSRYTGVGYLRTVKKYLPNVATGVVANFLLQISQSRWDEIYARMEGFLPSRFREHAFGRKVHRSAEILRHDDHTSLYAGIVSIWRDPGDVIIRGEPGRSLWNGPSSASYEESLMYYDTMTYLPDDIMTKVDRATMAVSLESRAPFLDQDVVEHAWRLPMRMKVKGRRGKVVLRRILERHLSKELFDRPKMGFGIPLGRWLRTDLRPWAESMLDPKSIASQGYFNPDVIARTWQSHLDGRFDHSSKLWAVLMFQAWLSRGMNASNRDEMS